MNDEFDDIDDHEPILEQNEEQDTEKNKESSKHDKEVRKRIDELLEKKRLKELFDDEDDWDI